MLAAAAVAARSDDITQYSKLEYNPHVSPLTLALCRTLMLSGPALVQS